MDLVLPDLNTLPNRLIRLFQGFDLLLILKIGSAMIGGVILTLYLCRIIGKISARHISAHHSQIIRRVVFYAGLALAIILPLNTFGVNVTALLSAAGIAAGIMTAAVAFAAQTSISNFLSGVFLLAEKPFQIGDYIEINNQLGEVLSIDLLSVKIRTKDNILVRIPNELLLKSQFNNVSRFPIRRCDIQLKVAFHADLQKVQRILFEVAKQNPLCLVSPAPELSVLRLGDSSVSLQFAVWGKQSSYSSLETNIQLAIQAAFVQHAVELSHTPTVVLESA